jgi:hypothetical protein
VRVAIHGAGRTLAWSADWESGPFVHVIDAVTGHELHRETCATIEVHATRSGFLAMDHGWRQQGAGDERMPWRLVLLGPRGGHTDVEVRDVVPDTNLVGVEPAGDRLLLFHQGRNVLCSWVDATPLAAWDGQYSPGVDWIGGYRWGRRQHTEPFVVSALDGSWEWALPGSERSSPLDPVGDGVARLGRHGVRLVAPRGDLLTVLTPTSRPLYRVHVGPPDGTGHRWVHLVLGGRPRRFCVDLGAPRVVDGPSDAARLARVTARFGALPVWHPTEELVALDRRRHRTMIMTTAGEPVCRLPERSVPLAWFPGDRSVLVASSDAPGGTPTPTTHLARWRVPDPSQSRRSGS